MKQTFFFENARLLSDKFSIIPLMYGSLGLEYITNENLNSDDIDILIPEVFVNDRWDEFKKELIKEGYSLFDEREHTFLRNGVHYSYASIEELESFAKIRVSDIEQFSKNGVSFKCLTLEQYLKVYSTSVKDGYRINVRQKKDSDKIAFISKIIKNKTTHLVDFVP